MEKSQFIFLKSKVSDTNPEIQKDTEKFIEEMDIKNIYFDGPVFFIQSGGTEEIFVKIFKDYKPPFNIIATDANNSLPAALEIESFLQSKKLSVNLYHGKPKDVAKMMNEKSSSGIHFNYQFKPQKDLLKDVRLGMVGEPSDWLIASHVSYDDLKRKTGAEVVSISFEEFKEEIDKSEPIGFSRLKDKINKIISEKELLLALRIYNALFKIAAKYKLDGMSVRCFDLLGTVHSTSCVALALLNADGIVAACEGDLPALVSMMILKKKMFVSSFQCNPSYINIKDNYGYFAHCTIPLDMCEEFNLDTHFESGIGVGIHGEMKCVPVTILKINADLTKFALYKAKIEENMYKSNLCRTQIKVRFFDPIEEVLTSPCGNHLIVSYGDHKDALLKILS